MTTERDELAKELERLSSVLTRARFTHGPQDGKKGHCLAAQVWSNGKSLCTLETSHDPRYASEAAELIAKLLDSLPAILTALRASPPPGNREDVLEEAAKYEKADAPPIPTVAADYKLAETVIANWCVRGDTRKTRQLIAEGIALARALKTTPNTTTADHGGEAACAHCGGNGYSGGVLPAAVEALKTTEPADEEDFQTGVDRWMDQCFGEPIKSDQLERADRFTEEALELAQTMPGFTAERAHALVDYVFNRPIGERGQEVGGVMVCIAALCNTVGLNVEVEAERELARIWTKVEQIRAKQAAKPTGSALPVAQGIEVAECSTCGATDPADNEFCSNGFHAPNTTRHDTEGAGQ